MFPVYSGKFLSRKVVHNLVEKFSQGRSNVENDGLPGAEVTETTVKKLLSWGFRRTGKTMGQVYQCWWRIYRKEMFFPGSDYTCYVLYPFMTCLLTLSRKSFIIILFLSWIVRY
jgi:hypothetical protein